VRRGSAPIQYSAFARMQNPVNANQTIATPTNAVNASHYGLHTSDRMDPMVMLTPTVG
jgi:hypothetical protein